MAKTTLFFGKRKSNTVLQESNHQAIGAAFRFVGLIHPHQPLSTVYGELALR